MSTENDTTIVDKLDVIREGVEATQTLAQSHGERLDQFEERYADMSEAIDGLREAQDNITRNGLSLPGAEDETDNYSISRVMRGIAEGNLEKHCPHELDISRECAKQNESDLVARGILGDGQQAMFRTMSTLSGATGGILIPEEVIAGYYPVFYAETVKDKLGVTSLNGLTGWPVRVNKQTSGTTAYRHGEGTAPTASDVALGRISLEPKKLSAYTVITKEDVQFTTPSVDGIVMRDQMRRLALRSDLDFFEGAGASNTPLGMVNTSGVVNQEVTGGASADLIWEYLVELELALANNNALGGSLAYVTKPGVLAQYRKYRIDNGGGAGTGQYLTPPGADPISPHPIYTTTQLAQGTSGNVAAHDANGTFLYFGNWADTIHALWGGMVVRRSDQASDGTNHYFTEDKVGVISTMWDDCAVVRGESVVYTDDVKFA